MRDIDKLIDNFKKLVFVRLLLLYVSLNWYIKIIEIIAALRRCGITENKRAVNIPNISTLALISWLRTCFVDQSLYPGFRDSILLFHCANYSQLIVVINRESLRFMKSF